MPLAHASHVFFGRGFRPFFLLAGAEAVLGVGVWLGVLRGWLPPPGWATADQWHAHEMLFGFAGAAVAGFLLTSVPVWTRRPAVSGARLAALVLLWLAARVAILFAASLPSPWLAPVLELSFLIALALAIGLPIYRSGSRRNYAFPPLILVLALANLLTHGAALGAGMAVGRAGMRLAVGVLVLLVSTLGGRLIPLFTGNALQRAGREGRISRLAWADAAAPPLLVAFFLADTVFPGSAAGGVLAWLAAATLALRARGWGLRSALGDPLLWSMHLAWWWIPLGLAALGLSSFSAAVPRNLALHALTVGCIGGMILAIMSRVALGHTGRPFRAPPGMAVAYGLVHGAAIARALLPLVAPGWIATWWLVSGTLWLAAFSLFVVIYIPFLVAPRIDGKPG